MSRPAVLGAALAVLLLTAVALASCAGGTKMETHATPSVGPAQSEMRVLAPSAVPGLPSTTQVLTIGELAKDAPIHGLTGRLAAWGYVDGRERTFQGESRRLTSVISRSLVFGDPAGAAAYVAYVRAHATTYFGVATGVRPLKAQGRPGWLFSPPACACHLANPVLVGVVRDGSHVVWLDINGPKATRALLMRLLDPAESAPTSVAG